MQCSRGKDGCGSRFTLRQRPELYKVAPRCTKCGSTVIYSVEEIRRRELANQERCTCQNIPFPHRKGSIKACVHSPHFNEPWTQEEEHQYQMMIETPRGNTA